MLQPDICSGNKIEELQKAGFTIDFVPVVYVQIHEYASEAISIDEAYRRFIAPHKK